MADDSHSTPFGDSATPEIVANDCRLCGGDGFVLGRAGVDACPRCAVIAEADWRWMQRVALLSEKMVKADG